MFFFFSEFSDTNVYTVHKHLNMDCGLLEGTVIFLHIYLLIFF